MVCKKRKYILHSFLVFILVCGAVLLPAGGSAQGPYKGEWVLPKHYPNGFDGWGRIDRLAADEVVIDDTLYPLSPSVTYNIPTNNNISSSFLRVGDIVGYLKNPKGFIISLWRIP